MNLNSSNPNEIRGSTTSLDIAILGGLNTNHLDRLRVTLKVNKKDLEARTIRHNLDLYNDNQVEKLVRTLAERLEIGSSIIREELYQLIDALEAHRLALIDQEQTTAPIQKELSNEEIQAAKRFLTTKNLLDKTNDLIGQSGVIGEELNRLIMYLIFTSRKAYNPLHVISLGSSGSGKTHLQSKVAELIPEEDTIEITALSEQALYYFNRTELKNKLLLIEDLDGATAVLYPLRELQSKRRITKTIAHKDAKGNTKTVHLVVEGPVSIAGATTKESLYEDNANRSFLLYIDESRIQDEKIMQYQRDLSSGTIDFVKENEVKEFLKNVQRILMPIRVINPFAKHLSLPAQVFKPRRTNAHYLQFIEAITFYHQYQRELKTGANGKQYIETTKEDVLIANKLLKEVLLRKSDMISGACRNYLERLKNHLKENELSTFKNREISVALRIPIASVKRYHKQLLNAQIIQLQEQNKPKGFVYEIADYDEYQNLQKNIERTLNDVIGKIE